MAVPCPHLPSIHVTTTDKRYCEDCIKTGDSWVQLRMCLTCGHVDAAIRRRTGTRRNTLTPAPIR